MSFLSSCTSGGCGAKIGPGELSALLENLPTVANPNLLVGYDSSDDAAVYKVNDELAIVSTMDFFSPMVEDPYVFGQIAATNALSDVYAMGGDVLFALNMVCIPESMDKQILADILRGGTEKVHEAGASIAGGHSIYDHEPKYGLAVTGQISPQKMIRNNTVQVGDILILTKALGIGLIQAAVRVDEASNAAEKAAIKSMTRLNKYASEKMASFNVHACTDVTGFGLLAHASEMVGTEYSIVIDSSSLPVLPDAYTYAENYFATASGQRNRNFLGKKIDVDLISPAYQELLFDPQTSGGLLISVAPSDASDLLKAIQKDDPIAAIIGEVIERDNTYNVIVV